MLAVLVESALRALALGGIVWLGLTLLRVRNPHAQMTAWIVVLAASLAMPLLMHRVTLTIPADPPPSPVIEAISVLSSPLSEAVEPPARPVSRPVSSFEPAAVPRASPPAAIDTPPRASPPAAIDTPRAPMPAPLEWRGLATGVYLLVAGVLMLRLMTGILLTWRMARAALPIRASWTQGVDVRVSDAVGAPVTFGSTVLLPPEYIDWSAAKRRAVLSHEASHVAHGDFYVLLLAAFNRALFWFNPFAWWQLVRLAELAEIISDDAAMESLKDRTSYADILLDFATRVQRAQAGLPMARACTVRQRVERILGEPAAPARLNWGKRALIPAALAPVVALSAVTIAFGTPPSESPAAAARVPSSEPATLAAAAAMPP